MTHKVGVRGGGHVICAIKTHCVLKSICDPLLNKFTMQLISIRIQELLRLTFAEKIKNHLRIFKGHFGRIVKNQEAQA